MLQADASDHAGDNKSDYTLIISAVSTSGATTTFTPLVLNEQAGVPANGMYQFIAVLKLGDGSVSTTRSNEFFIS